MPPRRKRRPIKLPEVRVDCKAGERYVIKRPGKPALTIRIERVMLNRTADGPQPKAFYVPLTRNGSRRRKAARYEQPRVPAWLVWRDGAWRFPHGERIDDA